MPAAILVLLYDTTAKRVHSTDVFFSAWGSACNSYGLYERVETLYMAVKVGGLELDRYRGLYLEVL